MREGIHPEYRTVVFRDTATGTTYRTRSTVATDRTVESDGRTYPLVVDTRAASHPSWPGSRRVLDTAGRVERFHRRHGTRGRR